MISTMLFSYSPGVGGGGVTPYISYMGVSRYETDSQLLKFKMFVGFTNHCP